MYYAQKPQIKHEKRSEQGKEREKAREANRNPLEREYLIAVHGRDKFHTLKETQAMHEFIHKVEQGADKKALLDEIIQTNKAKIAEILAQRKEQSQQDKGISTEEARKALGDFMIKQKGKYNPTFVENQEQQPKQVAETKKERVKDLEDNHYSCC